MTTIDATPTPATPETIQLSMTWEAAAPMLCLVLRDGTPQGQAEAQAELVRCARQADRVRGMAELAATRAAELAAMTAEAGKLAEARDKAAHGWARACEAMRGALAELRAPHYGVTETALDHASNAADKLAAYLAELAAEAEAMAAEARRNPVAESLLDCATLLRVALSSRATLDRGQAAAAIAAAERALGVAVPQAHARD